jgi:hypothetical protein
VLYTLAETEIAPPRIVRFFTVVFVDVDLPIPEPIPEPYSPSTLAVIDPPATVSWFTLAPTLAPIPAPEATPIVYEPFVMNKELQAWFVPGPIAEHSPEPLTESEAPAEPESAMLDDERQSMAGEELAGVIVFDPSKERVTLLDAATNGLELVMETPRSRT